MKVLHLIDHLGIGGAQTVVSGILTRDREQDCFATRKKKASAVNIDNVYCSMSKSKLNVLTLFKIKKLMSQKDYHILHCHLFAGYLYGYLLKRLWFPDIKLIFHEHGQIFLKQKLYDSFLNYSLNKVDLFIAVSEATERKLIENAGIPEEKIKVLYNFVDLENFNPEVLKKYDRNGQREKLGIKEEDFVIGFAGRLSKVKGCEYLLKAIPYINIPNFKVLIAGDGIERKGLEKLAKKINVTEKIIFLGHVKEILNLYGIIDVLVVPSKHDAFGISVIEAQACGVSVIASNVSAINALIKNEENGLLFEFSNEKELAEKIELMEKDKDLREKLVENGFFSVKRYKLETYLEELGLVYGGVKTENGCDEIG